jgi:purine-binding chemotaxis protein CheW
LTQTADTIVERVPDPGWVACFEADGEVYAIDVRCIREIVRARELTPLPKAPALIEGVVDLRGAIVPVVDLGRVLGGSSVADASASHIAIVALYDLVLGLRVAAALDVVSIDRSAYQAPPALTARAGYRAVRGVLRRPGAAPVLILSLEHLLEPVFRTSGSEPRTAEVTE